MAIRKKYENLLIQSVSEEVYNNKIMPLYEKLKSLESSTGVGMWMRPYIFSAALKAGYITIPEDFSRSMVGICVYR